ncbi:MAG TPA: ABC transporter permease [Dehalococcoidales bacterium]|nr:ABC transporter permease [Dehalococcoidales bacterium]
MTTYIIRRLIQALIVLILVTLIVFFAMRYLPGDPILMYLGAGQLTTITQEQIDEARHEFGLDKPVIIQYFDWVGGLFHGDFGTSITQQISPGALIKQGLPVTLNLAIISFLISLIIGIPAGIICAIRRGTWIDTTVTVLANIGITIPIFWLGTMLIYVFALQVHFLPVQGYTSPFTDLAKNIRQTAMPIFCLAIFPISSIARQTRSSMLEVMRQDYVRTAWSKGLRERLVVARHALKNSMIPVVTLSGVGLAAILGGSVLIETVFNIQGVGMILFRAISSHDYPVVQGFILVIAIFVLLINMLIDVSYGWLDPRIRYG